MRLGIAKGLTAGMTSRPKFSVNWSIEEPERLERLWDEIRNCLNEPRFGEYYAFRRVFGKKVAREVGEKGEFAVPPIDNDGE